MTAVKYIFHWPAEWMAETNPTDKPFSPDFERRCFQWINHMPPIAAYERRRADAPLWDTSPEAYIYERTANNEGKEI